LLLPPKKRAGIAFTSTKGSGYFCPLLAPLVAGVLQLPAGKIYIETLIN